MFEYFKLLPPLAPLAPLLFAPLRLRALRRLPFALGSLTRQPIERRAEDSYILPVLSDEGVRADLIKMIMGIVKRLTSSSADHLRDFVRPALIAWSREDRFSKPEHAQRLASDLPNARLDWIEEARTFSAEDQPDRLAELIAGFVREPASAAP